jgi:amidohydrolase
MLAGTVKLVFQPAEENFGGAEPMIAEGVMNDPTVEACFGLHVDQESPVGTISVRSGPMFAAEDDFRITIQGKGGHAALPHRTVDATLVAAEVVVALQSLVSREVDPLELAVVTVGMLRSGVAGNVIADRAELAGTVRTFDPAVRKYLSQRLPELVTSVATGMRAAVEIDYELGYPAVVNDREVTALVRRAAAETVGAERVLEAEPTLGADDMSYFLEAAPGCYFFVGSRDEASGKVFTHHPRFDIDERCLVIGVETLVRAVELFQQQALSG